MISWLSNVKELKDTSSMASFLGSKLAGSDGSGYPNHCSTLLGRKLNPLEEKEAFFVISILRVSIIFNVFSSHCTFFILFLQCYTYIYKLIIFVWTHTLFSNCALSI